MKFVLTGLALALAGTSTIAAAQSYDPMAGANQQQPPKQQQQQPEKPANAIQPSKKAMQAILDLQTAVNANDVANIPAKLAAAQAVATTNEDRYWIAQMQLKMAVNAKDNAAAMAAIKAMQATGLAPAAELGSLFEGVGGAAFNAKQYDQAVAAFQQQIALDPANSKALANLAASRAAAGHIPEAINDLQRAIKASNAAGKKADEDVYKRAVALAYEAKLPSAVELSREWVAAYPNATSWHNAIAIFRNGASQDTEGSLDLLRLMQATGAMQTAVDYSMFAQADLDQMNYNEAKTVLDAGIAAKVVNPADPQFADMMAQLKTKKAATAAELDAAVKNTPGAFNLLRIGDRFYGMGDYAKAAETHRKTLGKPGVDPEVVNLHIGMALARSGDKAGAIEALNKVTGARADIAKLWLAYAQSKA